jgi:Zn-dependent peptidase ImmA (M78 family)
MTIRVKYLSEAAIEKEAETLLSEYEETIGEPIKLPIPVADITVSHLALDLGFDDLHRILDIPMLHGKPDILGVIIVEKRLVRIDHHLDPKNNQHTLGRYHFSVAHEVGHWQLHRSYVARDSDQTFLLDASTEPILICRSSDKNERIEWQADFFASCLLMPHRRVVDEWSDFKKGCAGTALAAALPDGRIVKHSEAMIYAQRSEFGLSHHHEALCEEVARPIADRFRVSVQAMRIRLGKLGLLPRQNQDKATLRPAV